MGAAWQKKCKIFIPTWTKKVKNPAFAGLQKSLFEAKMLFQGKHCRNNLIRNIMGTKKISSFGIASSIVSVILFAFMFSAVRLALEEGFGFKSFVFMMVEHVCLQCFQKFRVHTFIDVFRPENRVITEPNGHGFRKFIRAACDRKRTNEPYSAFR